MKTLKHLTIVLSLLLSTVTHAEIDPDFDYIPVRRLIIFIEQSVRQSSQWTAFEQDTPALRSMITRDVSSFLQTLYESGALFGATPSEAYYVDYDASPEDIKNGRLILVLGVAPVKPNEFVTLRIPLKTSPSDFVQ